MFALMHRRPSRVWIFGWLSICRILGESSADWIVYGTSVEDLPMTDYFPEWIQPMAATLTQERFSGPEWIFERKFDGIRLLAFKKGDDVRLFSRNRLPQNVPRVAAAIAKLPVRDLILDGEIDWRGGANVYHIFDVVWFDDTLVTSLPLDERRKILSRLLLEAPLSRVEELTDEKPWDRACNEGWEGVIAKRRDSQYEHRRSKHWLKMKCENKQEFVVGGFTDPQGTRVGLGALLVGYYDSGDFAFAGKVGTGFDTKMLTELRARLDVIEIDKAPFTKAVGLPRLRAHWVKPQIVVHVAFIEWTAHGKLRHTRSLGMLDNMNATEIVKKTS